MDLYEILGISKAATPIEIKKAYRNLAKKYHPDKVINAKEAEKKEAEKKIKEINYAYEILTNEEKKKEYDLQNSNSRKPQREKRKAPSEKEIYENFSKGTNSMFNNFFDPQKEKSEKAGKGLKDNMNSIFKSYFRHKK